jgi:putative oxidoreductase
MKLLDFALEKYKSTVSVLERSPDAPALLTRLFVGYFFLETGVSKVQNLEAMTQRFIDWGIPAPAFNAALSGYTELIGGALIVVGLFTRLASVPMIINMIVAVLSVKLKNVATLSDFVEIDEPLYALAFLWLLFVGPGKLSLDHLLSRVGHRAALASAHSGGTQLQDRALSR